MLIFTVHRIWQKQNRKKTATTSSIRNKPHSFKSAQNFKHSHQKERHSTFRKITKNVYFLNAYAFMCLTAQIFILLIYRAGAPLATNIATNMATAADVKNDQKKHLGNHRFTPMLAFSADENSTRETLDDDCQLLPGIQLDSVRSFGGRLDGYINVTPIIVDFRSLLLSKTGQEIIKGVS